jgi:hypothetical protein
MAVKFSDREIELIKRSLQGAVPARKIQLLPLILREWGLLVLPEHLFDEPIAKARKRSKQLQDVSRLATQLKAALQAVEASDDEFFIVREMLSANGTPYDVDWRKKLEVRIAEESAFLDGLASAAKSSSASFKKKLGGPSNSQASLVIRDLAAIFT